jgi:hypothetical protein
MNTRFAHFTLCTLLLACSFHADAQQPKKVSRIGLMPGSRATYAIRIEAFQNGLRELGNVEGQTSPLNGAYPGLQLSEASRSHGNEDSSETRSKFYSQSAI